ncbi:hypothetical protein HPB50_028366 [Hyalomma asiaticum]|nr:hypothetical protein HPB50_028366 [Hyalomma asiaticum]
MTRALVAGDSMLKDLAGSFTLSPTVHVEVRSFSGVRIEKLFPLIAQCLADVQVVVLHVGTNNVGEGPLTLIARFRSLISRIIDVNPCIRVVVSAILPRKASSHNYKWALSVRELETFNTDAGETNAILQALCRKNGYVYVDCTRELAGMLKADGVHPTQRGSQLLGCLLREAIKRAVTDLEVSHREVAWQQQQQVQQEHDDLQLQYGDQSGALAQHWKSVTNFPFLCVDQAAAVPLAAAAPPSPCSSKGMWAEVVRRSASATVHCHSVIEVTPTVTEADTARGLSTKASAEVVEVQVKRRPPLASGTYQSGTASFSERPFRYQRRSVGFANESDLTRPFSCVYCSASFGRKDHLTVHVRRHMGDRPFKCDLCAKDFTRMYDLQRHIRMRHF